MGEANNGPVTPESEREIYGNLLCLQASIAATRTTSFDGSRYNEPNLLPIAAGSATLYRVDVSLLKLFGEGHWMKKHFNAEQMIGVLKKAEVSAPVAEVPNCKTASDQSTDQSVCVHARSSDDFIPALDGILTRSGMFLCQESLGLTSLERLRVIS